ncbi:hypothetical protein [Marinobacterium marinum]|uniref:Uncharacterized protein n=1 Tax=Marinobacterium marinum TaxID=2756129 RepID=A0A7W1WZT8_9GAMM|nr:hypothetical protein [Marinobacterium marinum]MBA4503268.1 hypothetical protein [Marinobacterium marinum]
MNMFSSKSLGIATLIYLFTIAVVIVNGSGWAALMDSAVVLGFLVYGWPFLLPMALVLIPLIALVVEGGFAFFEQDQDR